MEFKTKCKGNLFVYNMKKNNLSKELSLSLEYMKKYHEIDLVCIVMDHLNLADILEMSSFENIRYMFGRKDFPYIISVTDMNKNDRIIDILANKHFRTVSECTDHIKFNQNAVIEKIMRTIETEKTSAIGIIQDYTDKITDLEQKYTCQLLAYGVNLQASSNKSTFDKLKSLLLEKINEKINELAEIKKTVTKDLLRDPQMNEYFDSVLHGGSVEKQDSKNLMDIFSFPIENVANNNMITASDELFFSNFTPMMTKQTDVLESDYHDEPDTILEFRVPETAPVYSSVAQNIGMFNSIIIEETNKVLNSSALQREPTLRTQIVQAASDHQNKIPLVPNKYPVRKPDIQQQPRLADTTVVIHKTFSEGEF
jgi:hypothetical protein